MKTNITTRTKLASLVLSVLAFVPLCNGATYTNTVEKVVDLNADINGGQATPACRFTLIGTNLWFTTSKGSTTGFGTVSVFDPANSNVWTAVNFDNNTGKSPVNAALMIADGKAWCTTTLGGAGNQGTLLSMDTNITYPNTVASWTTAYYFPTNSDALTNNNGLKPHSTPIQIGNKLWFTCTGGGVYSSSWGCIAAYDLITGMETNMFSMDQTNYGRQPLGSSVVQVGDGYYYLMFNGGTNGLTTGTPNGAGVLGKITFDNLGTPSISTVCMLPGGFVSFPPCDVVPDGTNVVYFTCSGISTNPGAIAKYDLVNKQLTTLFTFPTNALSVTNYGKQPYGTPVLYNNELYFTTLAGGTGGKGVLEKLSLADNTVTKLADLEGISGKALGGSPQYGGGTVYTNPATGRVCIYFPINAGGVNLALPAGCGTILRVNLQPQPIHTTITKPDTNNITLTWTGGYQPFDVLTNSDLVSINATNWPAATNGVTSPTGTGPWSVTLPVSGDATYYYIRGQAQ